MGVIKTRACSAGVVCRQLPEVDESIFRGLLVRELNAPIVQAKVVIVPNCEVGDGGAQGGKPGLRCLGRIGIF